MGFTGRIPLFSVVIDELSEETTEDAAKGVADELKDIDRPVFASLQDR